MTDTSDLHALGSGTTDYDFSKGANADLLERFEAPTWPKLGDTPAGAQQVSIKVPEFTSLCPLTGQPDFATMIIEYSPKQWCVESKSMKLYMFSFRVSSTKLVSIESLTISLSCWIRGGYRCKDSSHLAVAFHSGRRSDGRILCYVSNPRE
jgi:7-cyano-7-deazaguanine reductase